MPIDRLRREQRHSAAGATFLDVLPDHTPSASLVGDRRWIDGQLLRQLMAELPAEQAQVIELAFFQGMTHSELAEYLGWPLGTVKTRLRSGLQKLRVIWREAAGQGVEWDDYHCDPIQALVLHRIHCKEHVQDDGQQVALRLTTEMSEFEQYCSAIHPLLPAFSIGATDPEERRRYGTRSGWSPRRPPSWRLPALPRRCSSAHPQSGAGRNGKLDPSGHCHSASRSRAPAASAGTGQLMAPAA